MNAVVVERDLLEQLGQLAPEEQRRVLDFARVLAGGKGSKASGQSLTRFAGAIPNEDLAAIAEAIEEGCERIDRDEW